MPFHWAVFIRDFFVNVGTSLNEKKFVTFRSFQSVFSVGLFSFSVIRDFIHQLDFLFDQLHFTGRTRSRLVVLLTWCDLRVKSHHAGYSWSCCLAYVASRNEPANRMGGDQMIMRHKNRATHPRVLVRWSRAPSGAKPVTIAARCSPWSHRS